MGDGNWIEQKTLTAVPFPFTKKAALMGGLEMTLKRWLSACCIGSDGEHLADRISYVPSYAGHESTNQLT